MGNDFPGTINWVNDRAKNRDQILNLSYNLLPFLSQGKDAKGVV